MIIPVPAVDSNQTSEPRKKISAIIAWVSRVQPELTVVAPADTARSLRLLREEGVACAAALVSIFNPGPVPDSWNF